VAIGDGSQRGAHVGERIDSIELAGFDERDDGRPVPRSRIVSGEESIFRFNAIGLMVRSTVLEPVSMRPSARKTQRLAQYFAM